MTENRAISLSESNGRVQCAVHNIPDWEGLEKIARFLEKHYSASILERADGPDARKWTLKIDNSYIELQHEDPWGNTIVALDDVGDAVVTRIGNDLETRLAGIEPGQ